MTQKNIKLKKQNAVLFLLLSTITVGIYPLIWFAKQKDQINKLTEGKKPVATWMFVVAGVYGVIATIVSLVIELYLGLSGAPYGVYWLLSIAISVIYYLFVFRIRRKLLTYFSAENKYQFKVSVIWTLLLDFVYLQYKINQVMAQAADKNRVKKFEASQKEKKKQNYSQYYRPSKKDLKRGVIMASILPGTVLLFVLVKLFIHVAGDKVVANAETIAQIINVLLSLAGIVGVVLLPFGIIFMLRKELIPGTPYDERSGKGTSSEVPWEIDKWTWGAWVLSNIYAVYYGIWWVLLGSIPYVQYITLPLIGNYANKWLWQEKKWISVDHFLQTEKKWNRWGIGIVIFLFGAGVILGIIEELM